MGAAPLPQVARRHLHISVGRVGIQSEIGVTVLSARPGNLTGQGHPQRHTRQRVSRLTPSVLLDKPSPAVASEPIADRLHGRADLALAHYGKVVEELPAAGLLDPGPIRSLAQSFLPPLQDLIDLGQGVAALSDSRRRRTRQRRNTRQVP